MPNIEANNIVNSLLPTDQLVIKLLGNNGALINSDKLFRQAINYNLSSSNTIRLLDPADQGQFAVDNNGRYVIPPNTSLIFPPRNFSFTRDLAVSGNVGFLGELESNTPTNLIQASGSGLSFINSTSCSRLSIEKCLFMPLSFTTNTPSPSGTLFNINNGSNPANWGSQLFWLNAICIGWNSLGTLGGFDFQYLREVIANYCVEGLTLTNNNMIDLLSYRWAFGIGNGTALTVTNTKVGQALNLLHELNPNEYAFNIPSDPNLEYFKISTSILKGLPTQGFKPGSLIQSDPKILVEGCDPLAPSTTFAHIIGAAATLTVPTVNDFHPTTSSLSLGVGGAERFVIEGSGTTQRIKYIGLNDINVVCEVQSAKTGSGGVLLGSAIGKKTGDASIPTSNTAVWDAINSTNIPIVASASNNISGIGVFKLSTNDYLKIYDQSSTTDNVTLTKHIITIESVK